MIFSEALTWIVEALVEKRRRIVSWPGIELVELVGVELDMEVRWQVQDMTVLIRCKVWLTQLLTGGLVYTHSLDWVLSIGLGRISCRRGSRIGLVLMIEDAFYRTW